MGTEKKLPSGQVVTVRDLSPYEIATTNIPIPNQALHDVLSLLTGQESSADPKRQAEIDRAYIRGVYEIAALWLESPRLVLRGSVPEGALTPAKLPWADAVALYAQFRFGSSPTLPDATDNPPGVSEDNSPAGDSVSHDTE